MSVLKTKIVRSCSLDPWLNLATEEFLLEGASADSAEALLFLYQNHEAVVIGKNQNPWNECLPSFLKEQNIRLARRVSGGGTVFHDEGNLNFCFIMNRSVYNEERQFGVLQEALQNFSLSLQRNHRNDLTIAEKKISGSAYRMKGNKAMHHGTLLVRSDLEKLRQSLSVSKARIRGNAVQSTPSSVDNLAHHREDLEVEAICCSIEAVFEAEYGKATRLYFEQIFHPTIQELYQKHASWEWQFGRTANFALSLREPFFWGEAEVEFDLRNGKIHQASLDAPQASLADFYHFNDVLQGEVFHSPLIAQRLRENYHNHLKPQEVAQWIYQQQF